MIIVVIAHGISTTIGTLLSCIPMEAMWKPWIPKKCIPAKPFLYSICIINISVDFIILLCPQPLVWRLHMKWTRKVLVSSIFAVGSVYDYRTTRGGKEVNVNVDAVPVL